MMCDCKLFLIRNNFLVAATYVKVPHELILSFTSSFSWEHTDTMGFINRSLITCLIIILVFTNTRPISCEKDDDPMRERYRKWMAKYNRTHKDDNQREKRFQIYKANVELIEAFNAINDDYKLTDNKFADITNAEFRKRYMGLKGSSSRVPLLDIKQNEEHSEKAREMLEAVPEKIDWRKKGAVSEVRDQGPCGACWAFSAVAAIEGITKIKSGRMVALSEQELVDCNMIDDGCYGGLMTDAFDFVRLNGGITTQSDYPYQGQQGECKTSKLDHHAATIKGYRNVTVNEQSLLKAVASQPVSVGIDASSMAFQFYTNGVFTGPCGVELNHGVTIVGYDTDGKNKYWIAKNSWGAGWGESGYMRMKRGVEGNLGLCGITTLASYPVV
ncbi:hypothetical protein LUZ62_072520 [Rhynchospora pubera]|uniref:Uncharacterized protein n=1 Tax=Rhynchospora pubera TaxID=906938 RepID=A0AAV8D308_9POAL|nr:hypothetical protein LUZ62_072520 [Rhynchospora pubera]